MKQTRQTPATPPPHKVDEHGRIIRNPAYAIKVEIKSSMADAILDSRPALFLID